MSDRNILGISTVYQRGKTQVPSPVRKFLEVKDGDRIYYEIKSGKVTMEKAPKLDTIDARLGKYRVTG